MNTKMIVALVVGIALVGLTGAASASYYNINGGYTYAGNAVIPGPGGSFAENSNFEATLTGTNGFHMHSIVNNNMIVSSTSSPNTDVDFAFEQGGANVLTIVTDLPGNMNTFVSTDRAYQDVAYVANGDAFDIDLDAHSLTHASTHGGILPIGQMAVWDHNDVWNEAWVNYNEDDEPMASIKYGRTGYECLTHVEVLMEAEHVLGPVTAGSGISIYGEAHGEIWEPNGEITNDLWGQQDVSVWWP